MRIRDIAQEVHQSLSAKIGRSALTVLGIAIGIMAAVVMVSLITGFSGWLEDSMGLGSARIVTVTSQSDEHALRYDDAAFLSGSNAQIDAALPEATTSYTVAVQGSSSGSDGGVSSSGDTGEASGETSNTNGASLRVVGVSSQYFDLEGIDIESGSAYADEKKNEIVLDEAAVESIYGDSNYDAVGQALELGGVSYRVVGIVESSSASSKLGGVSMAYVSYETMSQSMLSAQKVDALFVVAKGDADVGSVADQAVGMLAARHGVEYDDDGTQDAYTASTTESALESLENYTLAFEAIAAIVAGIALLVGGIGIMNMMLTNVSERYREIGLRKSLGARPADITAQFLAEAVALCLTGGAFGIIAGYAGAWGLSTLLVRLDSSFAGLVPVITPQLVGVVFAICTGIGIVFGWYPARRAARLDPAETLRYQ